MTFEKVEPTRSGGARTSTSEPAFIIKTGRGACTLNKAFIKAVFPKKKDGHSLNYDLFVDSKDKTKFAIKFYSDGEGKFTTAIKKGSITRWMTASIASHGVFLKIGLAKGGHKIVCPIDNPEPKQEYYTFTVLKEWHVTEKEYAEEKLAHLVAHSNKKNDKADKKVIPDKSGKKKNKKKKKRKTDSK